MENRNYALFVHHLGGGLSVPQFDLTFEQARELMVYWAGEKVRNANWTALAVVNQETGSTEIEERW